MKNLFGHIERQREAVAARIEKSFENDIEKARAGTYEDNAQNRKLNRVGMRYGTADHREDPNYESKKNKGHLPDPVVGGGRWTEEQISKFASTSDTEVLKIVANSEKAMPVMREAAKKELEKRGADKADKKQSALAKERSGKSPLKQAVGKQETAEALRTAWDDYLDGGDTTAEDLKQAIEEAGLTRDDLTKLWKKQFDDAGLDEKDLSSEIDSLFQDAGIKEEKKEDKDARNLKDDRIEQIVRRDFANEKSFEKMSEEMTDADVEQLAAFAEKNMYSANKTAAKKAREWFWAAAKELGKRERSNKK